jgi:hypothetical protein
LFQLIESQIQSFAHLSNGTASCEHLLPFKREPEALHIIDFWDCDIFRDDFSRLVRPNTTNHGCTRLMTEADKEMVKWVEENIPEQRVCSPEVWEEHERIKKAMNDMLKYSGSEDEDEV